MHLLEDNEWTHWDRVTHICVSTVNLTIIGSDNGLSPGGRQAIIWTNAGVLLIGPLRTNFSEILIEIYTFSFKKMHLEMSSGKWRPFCLGLNVSREFWGYSLWCSRFVDVLLIRTSVKHDKIFLILEANLDPDKKLKFMSTHSSN